jgi:hypothetical protein
MFGAIDHQRPVHCLATLARATAAGQDRDTFIACHSHRGDNVVDGLRDHYADWFNLVDRRIGTVPTSGGSVEQHRTLDVAGQPHGEGRVIRHYRVSNGGAHLGYSIWLGCVRAALAKAAGNRKGCSPAERNDHVELRI